MPEGTQRRLAAIVSADVVGYSRLMGADETGTIASLRGHRSELIDPKIAEYGGRIVKTMGDGLLLEFPSVVDATQCVIDIQRGMSERNRGVDEARRIAFRIGVNLGDIISDGDDILGDGVNIAARLEGLCEPGGITISNRVHEDVRDRLDAAFTDAGEQSLKNIARPVRVWRWSETAPPVSPAADKTPLALPDKPSIAVLPFDNMSGDPEQEYFSDGITEDLITALSKFRWFFVTARNSTFTYKGSAVDITDVGRQLGVRYVLEGSVRKAGNRIRITAQLIEAETGNHIWAERYDRELDDIFALQDEITMTIAGAVEPELAESERDRALQKTTDNLQAWDLFHRGLAKIWQTNRESMIEGAGFMRDALKMDPTMAQAYAYLAFIDFYDVILSRSDDRAASIRQGKEHARKALAIDQRDYTAHWALGRLQVAEGDFQSAISELNTAISINPNFANGHFALGVAYTHSGQPEKSFQYYDTAIRLSPNDPMMWAIVGNKGIAYGVLRDCERAIEHFEASCRFPSAQFPPFTFLAAFYAVVGRSLDAEKALARARRLEPSLSLRHMQKYFGPVDETSFELFFEGFRKVGLS